MAILTVWLQFAVLALVIGFAGYQLSFYADKIADRTGLGRNWIGTILLATVTSLPELMFGISSVRFADTPDLAVGNVLGACVFNLAMVFFLDLLHRESSVYSKATQGHIFSGALVIIMLSFVGFGMTVGAKFLPIRVGHVSGYTLVIPVLYFLAMRSLFVFERRNRPEKSEAPAGRSALPLSKMYSFFGLAAIVVLSAGLVLPFVAKNIIQVMGWSEAFVGTLFVALATSLPELAVTISAVRLRAVELAFSNVLGSNLFNIVILAIDDLFFVKGPLLESVTPAHVVTVFSAVMMVGLVVVALIQNPRYRILRSVSAMSLLLLAVYLLNAYIMFRAGSGHN